MFTLINKIIVYVKNEGYNLQTCANALIPLYHVVIWGCLNDLMVFVLGMHFQRRVNILQ